MSPPHKMPSITKEAIKALSPYGWSKESLDATYSMAIDELGFDPSMVNKRNAALMALKMYSNYLVTGKKNPLIERIGKKLYNIHWGINKEVDTSPSAERDRKYAVGWEDGTELGDYSMDDLKNDIVSIDEKYNIYNDKGMDVINTILDRSLVNRDTLRTLYDDKYKEKWQDE